MNPWLRWRFEKPNLFPDKKFGVQESWEKELELMMVRVTEWEWELRLGLGLERKLA